MMAQAFASAVVLLLCSLQLATAAPQANDITFPMLRDTYNATRQWRLAVSTGNVKNDVFTPVNCSSQTVGACTATTPALQQDVGDRVRIQYTLFNPRGNNGTNLNTYKNEQPTQVQIRICYSLESANDRAWRKKNKAYPRLSQNCPRTAATYAFNGTTTNVDLAANSGVAYWNLDEQDQIPTATWFVMMWVWCGNEVCAFESQEGRTDTTPPVAGNFFQTDVEMGITNGMRISAIILSIIGPLFMIVFYFADQMHYNKTGKPIRLF